MITKEDLILFLEDPVRIDLALPMHPVDNYDTLLVELGYERLDYETNGWECDFWLDYAHKSYPRITLTGSLFYGGFFLNKTSEEEE